MNEPVTQSGRIRSLRKAAQVWRAAYEAAAKAFWDRAEPGTAPARLAMESILDSYSNALLAVSDAEKPTKRTLGDEYRIPPMTFAALAMSPIRPGEMLKVDTSPPLAAPTFGRLVYEGDVYARAGGTGATTGEFVIVGGAISSECTWLEDVKPGQLGRVRIKSREGFDTRRFKDAPTQAEGIAARYAEKLGLHAAAVGRAQCKAMQEPLEKTCPVCEWAASDCSCLCRFCDLPALNDCTCGKTPNASLPPIALKDDAMEALRYALAAPVPPSERTVFPSGAHRGIQWTSDNGYHSPTHVVARIAVGGKSFATILAVPVTDVEIERAAKSMINQYLGAPKPSVGTPAEWDALGRALDATEKALTAAQYKALTLTPAEVALTNITVRPGGESEARAAINDAFAAYVKRAAGPSAGVELRPLFATEVPPSAPKAPSPVELIAHETVLRGPCGGPPFETYRKDPEFPDECPRCHGPAYIGSGYAPIQCKGGCK